MHRTNNVRYRVFNFSDATFFQQVKVSSHSRKFESKVFSSVHSNENNF